MSLIEKRIIRLILGLLLSCGILPLKAQFLLKEKEQRFEGNFPAIGIIKRTADGGFITGGSAQPEAKSLAKFEPPHLDFLVIKRNSKGAISWQKWYGGPLYEDLSDILPLADGGFLLCGDVTNRDVQLLQLYDKHKPGPGSMEYFVVRIDKNGNKLWEKMFGTPGHDLLRAALELPDGGFLLGGNSLELKTRQKDDQLYYYNADYDTKSTFRIFRLNSKGDLLWDRRYAGSDGATLSAMHPVPGGFLLLGWSTSGIGEDRTVPKSPGTDFWLLKIDSVGSKIWDKAYSAGYADAITRLADGNFLLTGSMNAVKIDPEGKQIWQKNYSEIDPYKERILTILPLADGSFMLGGSSISTKSYNATIPQKKGNEDYDFFVIKADRAGNKLWSQKLGGSGIEAIRVLEKVKENVYVLGGTTTSEKGFDVGLPSIGTNDLWLVTVKENPEPAIFTEARASSVSVENSFTVPLKINKPFNPGNIFTAQLSDSSGSFSNPLEIGKITATHADSIKVYLPATVPAGKNYQIRVIASDPAVTGRSNQAKIEIVHPTVKVELLSLGPGHLVFRPEGGRVPYYYAVNEGNFIENRKDWEYNFNNLEPGNHVFTIKDKAGSKTGLTISILPLKQCGEEVSGKNSEYAFILNQLRNKAGTVSIHYNFPDKPAKMEAFMNGTLVVSTEKPVFGAGVLQFPFDPAAGEDKCYIKISGIATGTSWQYKITCPEGKD